MLASRSRIAGQLAERSTTLWDIAAEQLVYHHVSGARLRAEHILVCPHDIVDCCVAIQDVLASVANKALAVGKNLPGTALIVERIFPGGDLLLAAESGPARSRLPLLESGSAADVWLEVNDQCELQVIKRCADDGIDGNGRPWLRRQLAFLESMRGREGHPLFLMPSKAHDSGASVTASFPYIPGLSLAEYVLRGADSEIVFSILQDVFDRLAKNLWHQARKQAPRDALRMIHLDRMMRRVLIASERHSMLRELLQLPEIIVNGETLLNFPQLLERLSTSSMLRSVGPRELSLIHGDLNLYNILCHTRVDGELSAVLLDPRGTALLGVITDDGVEAGDPVYDLGKLKFSLSGFVMIRSGLSQFKQIGQKTFELAPHPDALALGTLAQCNDRFEQWVGSGSPELHESLGEHWRPRLLLAEAANFISDAACCLARNSPHEVLPLFLTGLRKLNGFYSDWCNPPSSTRLLSGASSYSTGLKHDPFTKDVCGLGLQDIRGQLLAIDKKPFWDVIEILTKEESVEITNLILNRLIGQVLPRGTCIAAGHEANPGALERPIVLIHAFPGRTAQLTALIEGADRTKGFLSRSDMPAERQRRLRVLTIVSTGASSRNSLLCRGNDKLLMPGPFPASPLRMVLNQAFQLPPREGRWICNNDGLFLVSRPVHFRGAGLGVLAGRPASPDDDTSHRPGRITATRFGTDGYSYIERFEETPASIGHDPINLGVYYLPHAMMESLAALPLDLRKRGLSLVVDIVLQRCMKRLDWVKLARECGHGDFSDSDWLSMSDVLHDFSEIEFISAGDRVMFWHIGSTNEYLQFTETYDRHPLWKPFVHLPDVVRVRPLGA